MLRPPSADAARPAALVIAHPGHEVSLHGWLERTKPVVFVLTDGSGQRGASRLASTTRVLERAGARRGAVYGRFTDRRIYDAVLAGDGIALGGVAGELTAWLLRAPAAYVVTDAAEGYNPTHDLCRAITGIALEAARRASGRATPLYEYVVTGDRGACLAGRCPGALRWRLDDDALAAKLAAARGYEELGLEVARSLERGGTESYRVECLHPTSPRAARAAAGGVAFYERHGETRVASAKYARVIREREHMAPLLSRLWALAGPPLVAR